MDNENTTAQIQLPAGYEDAAPVAGPLAAQSKSQSQIAGVSLPAGFEDATPVKGPLVDSGSTPDFSVKAAVAGPSTALATPLSPEAQQEGSGVSDILHGDFRQGASKIWDAEKPHVIQGSLLEKALQKINPSFVGSVTNEDVAAHAAKFDVPSRPVVDAAQFIDKEQHPVARALAETAQSFTTPANVAILYSTGGLGLVDSPQALGLASRLISGGFSAAAIANAYKNLKGFKEAFDNGDSSEAAYQLTHAITAGTLGMLAARGAVTEKPLFTNPFRAKAAAARSAATNPIDAAVADSTAKATSIPAGSPATVAPTGETIQPTLQKGIRDSVNAAAIRNGFDPVPDTVSVRDVPKALGDQAYARSQATFNAAEKITQINFTTLKNNIFKLDDQISDLAITDPEKAGQLAQQKAAYEEQAAAGLKAAEEKGVNVKQARSDWNLQLRANELSNHVRNSAEGTLTDPILNPTKLTPRLQKMNEAEVGQTTPKLTQLLGEDAAKLVSHAENARATATEIKEFTPSSPTGQQALQALIRPNTGASAVQAIRTSLGFKPTTNWIGVFRDFNKLSPEDRETQFGTDRKSVV